jgi:hypothetical protein
MTHNVYVQNKLVSTINANNTGEVLSVVSNKIYSGEISVDETKPHDIRIEPQHNK